MAKHDLASQETLQDGGLHILLHEPNVALTLKVILTPSPKTVLLLRGLPREDSHRAGGQSVLFTQWPENL